MNNSNCQGCRLYVGLVADSLANKDYCNKYLKWINDVSKCDNMVSEAASVKAYPG